MNDKFGWLMLCLDEDLTAMYLSDKKNNIPRELHDHDDLEVLLESFSKQVEEIVNEAENIEVFIPYILVLPSLHHFPIEQCSIDTRNSWAYSWL